MHNPLEVDAEVRRMLDELGAEPLAGSGFENEQLELDFQTESGLAERGVTNDSHHHATCN
jgi:hypothetical protein